MTPHRVGILFSTPGDRLLLIRMLHEEGHDCWAPSSSAEFEVELPAELAKVSLFVVQEAVAECLGPRLLKHRKTVERFLPIIVTLRNKSEASKWLKIGYDDVIRLPLAPEELRSRLNLMLRHQERSVSILEVANEKLRRKNAELESARAEAHRANKAKTEFLANMSHELRTPLHGILGCVEILKQQDQSREQLEMIEISGRSLLGLVRELLDFSSLEAGQTLVVPQVVETMKHLEASIAPLRTRASAKALELHLELSGYFPEYAEIDPVRLSQLLANLVGNAIKFTEQGYVKLGLSWKANWLQLEVEDTGIGIASEHHDCIFQAFVQVDSSTTRTFEGTGLGLAIVNRIVEAMGGSVSLKSELDKGSIFKVSIPMRAAAPPASESRETETVAPRPLQVLVVEDNPINSKVLARLLGLWGHRAELATSGAQGVALAAAATYDLIIMDVQMPEMSGLEATRNIRSIELERGQRRVPIIALTARAGVDDREICLASGMDEYLTKPPDHQTLRTLIQQLTEPLRH